MTDDELLDLLTLQLTPGIGPVRLTALLERFGNAAQILRAAPAALATVEGMRPRIAQALREPGPREMARREYRRALDTGTHVVARGGLGYPPALVDIPGAPSLLFIRGQWRAEDAHAAGLVGTRHPSGYGRRVAITLATGLAHRGVVVVSGMARGIDGIAHTAALDAGGRTLAVLAGGFDHLYPPEHRSLAERIAANGALITESVPSQEPLKGLFPARNRIISGLSRAVVIVQAAEGSGALITATHAAEQGRPVLAVPGPVDEAYHTGCHMLIRQGATLCRHVDDILEEMGGLMNRPTPCTAMPAARPEARAIAPTEPALPATTPKPAPLLTDDEARVQSCLDGAARSMDELVRETGLGVPKLSGVLMALQMKRLIRQLPGNRYEWLA